MRAARPFTGLLLLLLVQAAHAQAPRRPFLFKDARGDLAAARARGDRDVLLVIASMPGANARVAQRITRMGGTVQFRDDDVDYVRARVPVDQVEALATDAAVHSVSMSTRPQQQGGGDGTDSRVIATDTTRTRDWPPPLLTWYPVLNRYDPLDDIRALEFRRQNPTFDGRGVTLAIIDQSLDPLLPELQTAYTLDGQRVPKIVGYETVMDGDEEEDGRWLRMNDTITAVNGRFTYRERSYTAPRAGSFRIELLDEAKFDSLSRNGLNRDLNRDGNPEGSSRLFAVLWDEQTNDVWVDTDQDGEFTDEKALTDFASRSEFGVFGRDRPETSVRESVAFAVQIDRAKKRVALNVGAAGHSSLVVGAAVASRGERGKFDGVAPGSQLVNVSEGCAAYGQTEAVIRAVKHPKVDVVWLEHCSNITRPYTLRDGRLTTTVIYERLIAKYRKPIMIPTHNYPVLGGTDDFVLAAGAIGVGGHESKENFFLNHGVRVEHDDNLLITGGYGPMGNGAFGADIISPSNYISTARGWEETRPIAGLYRLPPGYTIAGGTSTATPTAAGAVALLISAARQSGIQYDAFRIRHAILSSARYVPHIPAYKQGSGVVNVAGAWEILQALDRAPDPVTIVARAPVRHNFSHTLPTPHQGVGLYEREGWRAGQRGERTITFTRTSGPRERMTFALDWIGNDAQTFSASAAVTLPLNQPVSVTVTIAPATAGAHSAILTLAHPDLTGLSHRMLATIVAGEPLLAENNFTMQQKVAVPRPEMRSFFYDVPDGVSALRVDIDQPGREVAVALVRPDTRTASAVRTAAVRGAAAGGPAPRAAGRATYVVTEPMSGVWEVRLSDLEDVRTSDRMQAESNETVPPTQATLTVSAIAVAATAVAATAESSVTTQELTLKNMMAAFEGSVAGMPYGAARRQQATIRSGEQLQYEIDVPAGSSLLLVRAGDVSDAAADLDVYVFDCTGRECRSPRTDSDPFGDEVITIANPAAGKWKVVVDGASVPSGSTRFAYLDAIFNPSYGAVATIDLPGERKSGDEWTTQTHRWLAGGLPAGREPYPAVLLQGRMPGNLLFDLGVVELAKAGRVTNPQQR
ncbi:MAG TPA: S8 family serine peptidase [Longimicrobiales bacterium]|nr:S8 family serine peptidase [Longimicrobiales bacterium]